MHPDRQFLIIGNGRTGSSWLLTSLDRLHDVTARQEIKWPDGARTRADAHVVVDPARPISEAIRRAATDPLKTPAVIGSKLIFNPYSFHGKDVFKALDSIIGSASPILLKRDYLDTWLSWKARGVSHDVDETADTTHNPMLEAMRRTVATEVHDLVLHHGGGALSDRAGIAYPLETAVDDLLQFYANDMQTLDLIRHHEGLVVDYSTIRTSLREVAQYIDSQATPAEIAAIALKPTTRKLPSLRGRLHPLDRLKTIAEALDQTFRSVADGFSSPQLAFRWMGADKISLGAPPVVSALKAEGFEPHGHEIIWRTRKPILAAMAVSAVA